MALMLVNYSPDAKAIWQKKIYKKGNPKLVLMADLGG